MNILLVDTDSRRRARVRAMLLPAGHSVCEAADSATALTRLVETLTDVVLVEADLGGTGGGDLFRRIRTEGAAHPPYLISVRSQGTGTAHANGDSGWTEDADDILPNPVRPEDLMARIEVARRVLDRRRDGTGSWPHGNAQPLRDPLTGLPTRSLLSERMGQAIHQARLTGTSVAMVKVNLDNCAEINDAYGHHIGDQLLQLVGEALRDTVRTGDTVLRDAGDGFILVLQGIGNRETAGTTCSRFIRAAQQAGDDADLGVQFTLSLGLALFPDDADSERTLVERADHALVEAKNSGRNCWRDYQAAVGANPLIGTDRLLPRLMAALQARQLHAQYQPIIASASGAVDGFEALVRWQDPELGWIPPDRFIPIAESRGLISEVGRQMADMVFRQLAVWRDAGHPVTVSLNISKHQLWEPRFADEMRELANDHRLNPAWIILEATERQSLVHDPVCREALEGLAAAGFRLSIDDFGTGHSTFDMVTELPFHELKINMTLSQKVRTPKGRHVVRAILEMCENLGLESVAEGIEDAELGDALRAACASKLQGYHFSPPLRAEATLEFHKRSRP
ncbi:MAG: putative bifunctional diguanylate cyclase/phosphodiesterase [Limisphaerales bacterium]